MAPSREDLSKMHWRDRWEYEARQESENYNRLSEAELLKRIQGMGVGRYFSIWRAIAVKGTVDNAALVLWDYLQQNPGKNNMHNRYHCTAALFHLLQMPDPASQNDLRKAVQWDSHGEEERQRALIELKEIILDRLES